MNELVAVASFIALALLVVGAARFGQQYLFVASVSFILLSNITVQMPVVVFGVEISWAIIIYSLVYFITDILCEYYGRAAGYRLAATNLAVQLLMWGYVWASLQVVPTPAGTSVYVRMQELFATTAQVTFAAIVASAGPFLDIFVFTVIRERWKASMERRGGWLATRTIAVVVRNKVSTFAGQILNTVLFFWLVMINTDAPSSTVISIIVSASIIKILISLADTPFLVLVDKYFRPVDAPANSASSSVAPGSARGAGA